jgi:hypothetical protein
MKNKIKYKRRMHTMTLAVRSLVIIADKLFCELKSGKQGPGIFNKTSIRKEINSIFFNNGH